MDGWIMRAMGDKFMSKPSPRRLGLILGLGIVAIVTAALHRSSLRPKPVPGEIAKKGLAEVRAVVDIVRQSEFGGSERGSALTGEIERFLEDGRIVFTADISGEALYRKEPFAAPVLYIVVYLPACVRRHTQAGGAVRGHLLPDRGEIAQRLYHEALHSVKRSPRKSLEEECDAFCAAEEARAAIEGRAPAFPLERDGRPLWEWVTATYRDATSDPSYLPVGQTPEDLAEKSGIVRPDGPWDAP